MAAARAGAGAQEVPRALQQSESGQPVVAHSQSRRAAQELRELPALAASVEGQPEQRQPAQQEAQQQTAVQELYSSALPEQRV